MVAAVRIGDDDVPPYRQNHRQATRDEMER